MELLREHEGKEIRFESKQAIKGNPIFATLISFNQTIIQVRLKSELHLKNTSYSPGTIRIFSINMISDIRVLHDSEINISTFIGNGTGIKRPVKNHYISNHISTRNKIKTKPKKNEL